MSEWIDVNKAYPEEDQEVLCIDADGRRYVATFSTKECKWGTRYDWNHGYCCGREPGDPTHWMPLPASPEKEE